MTDVNLVWLKRDLRLSDHQALWHACQQGKPVVVFHLFEPEYWQLPDTSYRQWRFILQSLGSLRQAFSKNGGHLSFYQGDIIATLRKIAQHCRISGLYSHEETGNHWTYQRDTRVSHWCQQHAIPWYQYQQFAVKRGPINRDNWDSFWHRVMDVAPCPMPALRSTRLGPGASEHANASYPGNDQLAAKTAQFGGIQTGERLLESFLAERHTNYLRDVSSPSRGQQYSSRLSPYLAYGCLSLRQVVLKTRQSLLKEETKRTLQAFKSRLHWHCHFIQKLETSPEYERTAIHPDLRGIRTDNFDGDRFKAWAEGQTGIPFVDACMRYLRHTGWLPFRLRAMLTAFSSYHLWLPWQHPAQYLASLFTDYEPGIHYPQIQMQSGTTGMNPFRIYNPIKQGQRLDPDGHFIRRWLPELAHLGNSFIHQPWLCAHVSPDCYPAPIVEVSSAARLARQKLAVHYRQHVSANHTQKVIKTHASRRREGSRRAPPTQHSNQLDLF
ncbi:Deoxyribodipyrimidine photo-lyase [Saliniradius amylolyticus]|uniref:Deoxyribodipyrimidine photo-lyase n=1 Tax=Saliniradius amylolyticus TaxID=2183582 RepID=A0A2S2E5C3_9ALTE|nr:deoxyribodipyrimidine photo-lyase [Saliniradius amylolyticus]AWL12854.1 Deoxyribodipyrimidine photo-lyase [Saliniradius amylolyticus]